MGWGDSVRRRDDQRPSRQSSSVIPQSMLEEYRRLEVQQRRYKQVRKQLLGLVEGGAHVEDGHLDVGIKRMEQRRLSIAVLVELLGEDEVEQLREAVEPVVYRTLVVTERPIDDVGRAEMRQEPPASPCRGETKDGHHPARRPDAPQDGFI